MSLKSTQFSLRTKNGGSQDVMSVMSVMSVMAVMSAANLLNNSVRCCEL